MLMAVQASLLPAQSGRGGARRPTHYTPQQLRAAGEEVLNAHIARYSRVNNAQWEEDVSLILRRLKTAAALTSTDITWAIVGNDQINAAAAPGGFMVVNAGLLQTFQQLAQREAPTDSVRQRERYLAYVASVLSHELAHLALGHTDEVMERVQRAQRNYAADTVRARNQVKLATYLRDSTYLAEQKHGREVELEADRAGSLFMLRAGWEIQDAMDLFHWLDVMERRSKRSLSDVTWLRSHPRSSSREASLEAFRAQLRLHQATYDDALALIDNSVMLDSAVAMLDRVLADLPDLIPAKHARAAALHAQWLNGAAVQQLQVRGSVPTYNVRFVSGIRGAPGDPSLLQRARRAYESVLGQRILPYTLSNLAVLDAYAGELAVARRRADSAAVLSPNDPAVLNNQGVVLYLSGQYALARDAFMKAGQASSDGVEPSVVFNIGRAALQLGDSSAARQALARIATHDDGSGWQRYAMELLMRFGGGPSMTITAPASAAPSFADVSIGMSASAARAALGAPDVMGATSGRAVWTYRSRGLRLIVSDRDGVLAMELMRADAGEVGGVRVGDVSTAMTKLGMPSETTPSSKFYRRGSWGIVVTHAEGLVSSIMVKALP